MRRSDREIKDLDKIIEVMRECDVCRLAFNDGEYPYILPLNFGMEITGGQIVLYFHGAAQGRKYELMEKNNKASFEMDCGHTLVLSEEKGYCTMAYKSVIGSGRVEMVEDDEKIKALNILMRHYRDEGFKFDTASVPVTKVFKLTVENVTGKERKKK